MIEHVTPRAEAALPPRVVFGKWAQKGVPHTGWECVLTREIGSPSQVCEMCETRRIRFVHYMQHADYPKILEVGSGCAGKMEGNPAGAGQREGSAKNRAARRAKWLERQWKESANANPWIRTQGYRVVICRTGPGWTFTVACHDRPPHHAAATFPTSDEAKLAAFDFIWPTVSRVT